MWAFSTIRSGSNVLNRSPILTVSYLFLFERLRNGERSKKFMLHMIDENERITLINPENLNQKLTSNFTRSYALLSVNFWFKFLGNLELMECLYNKGKSALVYVIFNYLFLNLKSESEFQSTVKKSFKTKLKRSNW